MAGLPWEPAQICFGAEEFLKGMNDMDQEIAKLLNEEHAKQAESLNKKRPQIVREYKKDDLVFILRPNETGGVRLHTRFHGPYRILARVGEHSYQVKMADLSIFDVHVSHLKPCIWEAIQGPCLEMRVPPDPSSHAETHS